MPDEVLAYLGPSRQLATLLATVIYLEGKAVDDCLEMLDVLVTTELVGKAETATDKERVRQHPKLAKHSATLAAAVETLLEVTEYGEELRLDQVWEAIDAIVPRRELREAVAAVTEMVPPPDADADGEMRALLATRIATVSGFLKTLTTAIEFGANAEGARAPPRRPGPGQGRHHRRGVPSRCCRQGPGPTSPGRSQGHPPHPGRRQRPQPARPA
ncbi:hypothetical protein FE391_24635 [Nonomuraea sp. KC401]|uniref:hypothetical protein n=1 Tax=unclassified Nonomuraea TaxID=2593643 RepID=UPI0010FCF401|nr:MULTISPECIES: hypothetical protein [unclassified Nonomuraea]TLF66303.1 hypothetical protein FE391_24635 [Nonomuraea sp. KC401]